MNIVYNEQYFRMDWLISILSGAGAWLAKTWMASGAAWETLHATVLRRDGETGAAWSNAPLTQQSSTRGM